MNDRKDPILYIVIPCYNEQEVLPITAPLFLQKINRKQSEKKNFHKPCDRNDNKRICGRFRPCAGICHNRSKPEQKKRRQNPPRIGDQKQRAINQDKRRQRSQRKADFHPVGGIPGKKRFRNQE